MSCQNSIYIKVPLKASSRAKFLNKINGVYINKFLRNRQALLRELISRNILPKIMTKRETKNKKFEERTKFSYISNKLAQLWVRVFKIIKVS